MVKTLVQQLKYTLKHSRWWRQSAHLTATIENTFFTQANLDYMEVWPGSKSEAWVVDLVLHFLKEQAWSLAVRHSQPPEVYSLVLSDNEGQATRTCLLMQKICLTWHRLENVRHMLDADDATFLQHLPGHPPTRMLHALFEKGKFDRNYGPGRKYLRGQLQRLLDNKLVEDVHLPIKRNARSSETNTRQRAARIQEQVVNSNALEARCIPHPADIDKDTFEREFPCTTATFPARRHHAAKHRLPV